MAVRVPILRVENNLLASVQAALSDEELADFACELAQEVGRQRVSAVIIDVSALDVIDSYASRQLRNIAVVTRLRGARTIMVGVQPGVAYSLVQLGMRLPNVEAALDLDDALAHLRGRLGP